MILIRSLSKMPALALAAAFGLAACSDEPAPLALRAAQDAQLSLEVSSASARVGSRVGVALRVNAPTLSVAGIQGTIRFNPAELAYVGQSATTEATAIINPRRADRGELAFTSFDIDGMQGRVANLVFEVRGTGYAQNLKYDHYKASTFVGGHRNLALTVGRTAAVDASVPVPSDARVFSFADWRSTLTAAGEAPSVALRPGDLGTVNLQFGDIDYNGAIGLDDYLGVAFAVVGLEEIVVGTDGPARDVDLVVAGNVFPDNGGTPRTCGTNVDGSRALDLDDYLGIAFFAVGLPTEPCIGQVIPGRGPATTMRQELGTADVGGVGAVERVVASGETFTLTNDRIWQINSKLRVQNGGVLNIQAGTRIEGNSAATATALFVERGGQINANGTQYQPITFTCTNAVKTKACWGGIFIAGRGTVNLGDATLGPSPDAPGCNQRGGEGGGPRYGGCNPSDNSGSLTYAVIEYAGYLLSPNNELNCLTMGALGSGTTIHHVQCHAGSDDGFEFFGGDISTRHLVATGNDDDGFDVSFGIRGNHQFVIIQSDVGATNNDSKAIEADGYEGTISAFNLPRTSPRLWNFTIIGDQTSRTQNSAIHLRRGSGLRLYNSVISGYEIGVDLDDALTCNAAYGDGIVELRNNTFVEVANLGQNDSGDPLCGSATSTTEGEEEFVRGAGLNNVELSGAVGAVIGTILRDGYNVNLPDWRMLGSSGSPVLGNTFVATGGAVATNYRGAVASGLGGSIPWYSGWTRPWQGATTP